MGTKRKLFLATMLTALIVPSLAMSSIASASPPRGIPAPQVLASGLEGASGATIGPDGALYVAEGKVGKITRIDTRTGETSTFASGLPKAVFPLGGAIDVEFVGHTAYVLVTLVGEDVGGTAVDGIYRVDDADSFTVVADLGEFSRDMPPKTQFDLPSGVQFSLEPIRGGFLVSDGHHNRVLKVTRSGEVSELIAFGNTVPTGLAATDGTVYLAEAGPIPHAPADGKIVKFGIRHPVVKNVAAGFSLLVDVEFGKHGALYALSQGDSPGIVPAGSPSLPDSGELLRVKKDGTFAVVVEDLDLPTSVDIWKDTAYVVTLGGDVLKIRGLSRR